jgi:hypothetical protein
MSGEPSIFAVKWTLFTVGVSAVCVLVTWFYLTGPTSAPPSIRPPSTGSTSTTTSASPPNEPIAVTLPPNSAYSGTVSVAIPDRIIDKLGPSHDSGVVKFLGSIWPGASALIGALIGGLVTLAAGRLNNAHQREAEYETRRQVVRDRTFSACADVLKAGRLQLGSTKQMWYNAYIGATHDQVRKDSKEVDKDIQDWYSVSELLRLTLPPGAKSAFKDYADALSGYVGEAWRFRDEYLEKPLPDPNFERDNAGHERLDGIEDDVLAKRNAFIDAIRRELDEGTAPRPPTGLHAILFKFKGTKNPGGRAQGTAHHSTVVQ